MYASGLFRCLQCYDMFTAARAAPDSLSNPPAVEAVLAGRAPVLEALLQTEAPARCGCTELLLPSRGAALPVAQAATLGRSVGGLGQTLAG